MISFGPDLAAPELPRCRARQGHDESMSGDLRREPFPDFERTIPVGEHFRTRNGGAVVLLSVDLWSDRIALNFAYEGTTHPLTGSDGHPRVGPDRSVADDHGTTYRWRAGGGGGADDFCYGYAQFAPTAPEAARRLIVSSPELRQPIEVPLAP